MVLAFSGVDAAIVAYRELFIVSVVRGWEGIHGTGGRDGTCRTFQIPDFLGICTPKFQPVPKAQCQGGRSKLHKLNPKLDSRLRADRILTGRT